MNKTPFWRRRYVVDWSLQARYTIVLSIFSAFSAFALGLVVFRAYWDMAEASPSESGVPVLAMAGLGIVFMVAATAFGLVLSNRWAGPLFRMERYLRQMADGGLPVIHPPRKGDELHGLFSTFREASEFLRSRQERELETLEGTLRLLEQQGSGTAPQIVEDLRSLTEAKRASLTPAPAVPTEAVPAPDAPNLFQGPTAI